MNNCEQCNKIIKRKLGKKFNKCLCRSCWNKLKQSLHPLKKCECSDGCNEMIPIFTTMGKPMKIKYEHRYNRKGLKHPNYKVGRHKHEDYWMLRMPDYYKSHKNGYVKEHIYNYEQYHKCCMLPWGDVHHIDGNKENNMIWNLQGMTHGKHTVFHKTK